MTVVDWTAIGSALATIAVAWFAWVQVRREARRTSAQERAAKVRISAVAYLLRERLAGWVGGDSSRPEQLNDWLKLTLRRQMLAAEVAEATRALREMMDDASDAPEDLALNVRTAFVSFVLGVRRLQDLAGRDEPGPHEIYEWIDVRDEAYAGIRECLDTLEARIIEADLLNQETALVKAHSQDSMANTLRQIDAALDTEISAPGGEHE